MTNLAQTPGPMARKKRPEPEPEPRPGRPCRDGDAPAVLISFRLSPEELARLDRRRKKAPRSMAIRDALAAAGLI